MSYPRDRYHVLMHAAADAIVVIDRTTDRIQEVNPQAGRLWGCSIESLVGLSHQDLYPADRAEWFKRQVERAARHPDDTGSDLSIRTRSQQTLPVAVNASEAVIDGRPHLMCLFRDISARHRAELSLLRRDRLLEAVVNAGRELIAVGDFDKAQRSALRTLARAFQADRIAHVRVDGPTATILSEWYRNDQPVTEIWLETLTAITSGQYDEGLVNDHQLVVPIDQARQTWLVLACRDQQPWEASEEVIARMAASVFDAAVFRREMEADLLKSRSQAETVAQLKSDFLATMSHEIRTPLNGIIGMSGLLVDGDLSTQARELAALVRTSGLTLLSLINDILDFSKIEAGRMELEPERLDVIEVGDEVLDLFGSQAEEKGIDIAWRMQEGMPRWVQADVGRIRQILVNLIGNALKFTKEGWILLDVESLEANKIRLTVRDTGPGVSDDLKDHLFQPFVQETGLSGGTGLGLSISQRLAEMMGGSIGYAHRPGGGACFQVDLSVPTVSGGSGHAIDAIGQDLTLISCCDAPATAAAIESMTNSWAVRLLPVASHELPEVAEDHPRAVVYLDSRSIESGDLHRVIAALPHPGQVIVGLPLALNLVIPDGVRSIRLPLRRLELSEALRCHGGERQSNLDSRSRLGLSAIRTQRGRVLVVEDNAINQRYAEVLLERLGQTTVFAGNGSEAVTAFENDQFDLILMDCRMPEMDGYQATQAIRSIEHAEGKPPTPIVAMTASALSGERERCLAAGMDDYLPKPVRHEDLSAFIVRYVGSIGGDGVHPSLRSVSGGQPDPADGVSEVDDAHLRHLRDDVGMDMVILKELADLFIADADGAVRTLNEAFQAQDLMQMGKAAHRLAGAAENVGLVRLGADCRQAEAAADAGQHTGMEHFVESIEARVAQSAKALRDALVVLDKEV